jgi:hypothetical protein
MILAIDVEPEDILLNENGRIIVKIKNYNNIGAHLWVTSGNDLEDFENNPALNKKSTLFIGVNGGLSF